MPYLKDVAPYYYDWIRHQPYEPYWEWGNLRTRYARVRAAVLNLSGWYDEPYGPEGATTNFLGLLKARAGEAGPRTKLLIGPWVHGVEKTKMDRSGDRKFGPAAKLDYDKVVLDWLDHYVRGLDNDVSRMKPVRVFVMGDDRWREEDCWPLKETRNTPIYLTKNKETGKGALSWQPAQGDATSSFVADPANPVKDEFGTNFGAYDLRKVCERSDLLVFDGEALAEDLEVTGQVVAEIYLSADAPDCDLFVKLLDVAPDGTAFNLMSPGMEALRVSYRDETPERRLLAPGQVVKLNYENMRTGNTFKKGHRLRVVITASWYPIYARNLQTGKLESESAEMRKATITIHHDAEHPSRLVLPVIPRQSI
jgi:putative CocE/NonD family hydrolase